MDALLKALFSQLDGVSGASFEDFKPEQLLQAEFGQQGGDAGSPYGLWGSMFGDYAPQNLTNPLKAFSPSFDPMFLALINSK